MQFIKRTAAVSGALLLPAAVALAATAPSGTFSGNLHYQQAGKPTTLPIEATFDKGKLTEIKATPKSGAFIPYNPKKSTADSCGDANTFDMKNGSNGVTISGSVQKDGSFSYTAKGSYDTEVTLKGKFVSNTQAKSHFRYYQGHLPRYANGKVTDTGHCDSGELRLKLTAG